jgi:hypothetical protein
VVLLLTQDIDEERDDVRAPRERDAGDDVESDPEAPGYVLREIGDDESPCAKRQRSRPQPR